MLLQTSHSGGQTNFSHGHVRHGRGKGPGGEGLLGGGLRFADRSGWAVMHVQELPGKEQGAWRGWGCGPCRGTTGRATNRNEQPVRPKPWEPGPEQTTGPAGRRPAAVRQVSTHSGPPSLPTCRPGPSRPAIKGACLRPARTHRCSASPIIRETQVRATRSRLTHGFYEETKQALGRMWRNRTPVHGRRERKSARHCGKRCGGFSKNDTGNPM